MIDSVETDAGGVSPDLKKARRQKEPATGAARMDRLPPHSIEAEQGVLGCVLLSPNECMGECIEKLKDKVERARGGEIGLDPRFEYFRYRRQPRFDNAAPLKWFDEYPVPPLVESGD